MNTIETVYQFTWEPGSFFWRFHQCTP